MSSSLFSNYSRNYQQNLPTLYPASTMAETKEQGLSKENMEKIKEVLRQTNGNAKEAFYVLCRGNGIDPDAAGNQLLQKIAGIPNMQNMITSALGSSPQLKELATLLR